MKFYSFFNKYNFEFVIFILFFSYFYTWNFLNLSTIEMNNNELNVAINTHNYNPYFSYIIYKISEILNLKIFFGFILFPSFVAVVLFKIFYKLLNSRLWAISISLLSIISTENYPFIKYFFSLLNSDSVLSTSNLYENFEIQGFPLPSFSILYFSILFFYFFKTIRVTTKYLFIITPFWLVGPLVHPFDGLICLIFWNFILVTYWLIKKITISKNFFIYTFAINLIIFILILSQIDLASQIILENQKYKTYNFLIYNIIPITLIVFCIKYFKVDLYEFKQRFMGIYVLFFIELIFISLSLLGYGFDLRMIETRIFMFLIHFLYYVPVIYYLSRDSFFILDNDVDYWSLKNLIKKTIFIIFCKLNKIYLPIFSLLMVLFLIHSLNLKYLL